MTTWLEFAGLKGYYETNDIDIVINGDAGISTVNWNDSVPSDTKLHLYSSCSFNGGSTWTEWKKLIKNQSIPSISLNEPTSSFKIKFRAIMETNNSNVTPYLTNITLSFIPVIIYNNLGDLNISPEIEFEKIGNGNLILTNITNNNEQFIFTNIVNGEKIYVHNEQQIIKTSFNATNRYPNFNDNYLDLPVGVNIFKVSGNAKIQFRSQFIIL